MFIGLSAQFPLGLRAFERKWKASTISGQDKISAVLAYRRTDGKTGKILTGNPQKKYGRA